MSRQDSTCWTMIMGAAAGREADRRAFATRYLGVVRAYLRARWTGSSHLAQLDDAVQEVFLELLREGGALARVDPSRAGGFRAFFYGVVRNVALRIESGRGQGREASAGTTMLASTPDPGDEGLSAVFDRAWARAVMREAADRLRAAAAAAAPDAHERVELLRLRFHEGLPIRRIAELWNVPAERLHREYARARREFRTALEDVIAFHHPGSPAEIANECERLLELLA